MTDPTQTPADHSLASSFTMIAGAVGGLGVICYAVGYLIALGSSLKLGLPINLQENQSLIVHGATFPLGVIANAIIATSQSLRAASIGWPLSVGLVFLIVALVVVGLTWRWPRVGLLITFGGLAASLYYNWAPIEEQGLLLESPPYLSKYDRESSDADQAGRQLSKDIQIAEATADPAFRTALDERVQLGREALIAAQRRLAAQRDSNFEQHRLVYCTFFRTDSRCANVATVRFALLSVLSSFVVAMATWRIRRGTRRWVAVPLTALCTFDASFLMIDYGWLLGRTEYHIVQTDEGDRVLYLGDVGDRYVMFSPATRTLTLRAKSDVSRLTLIGTTDVFAEIEERSSHAGQ